jgi:hypothetical protein
MLHLAPQVTPLEEAQEKLRRLLQSELDQKREDFLQDREQLLAIRNKALEDLKEVELRVMQFRSHMEQEEAQDRKRVEDLEEKNMMAIIEGEPDLEAEIEAAKRDADKSQKLQEAGYNLLNEELGKGF